MRESNRKQVCGIYYTSLQRACRFYRKRWGNQVCIHDKREHPCSRLMCPLLIKNVEVRETCPKH